ncbi:TPA: hypothetical protein SI540_004590 [Escherichia coli]|nr:hypothetical protein [Escherichia coli]HEI2488333.1 hypothetical protein [Escherichia coli]HEI2493873.1 hypothetical protein [Escherichia coli]HEI2555884.1 hypothetical protein [Escherichia coli]HEI2570400.1 hypothetical protein [Escherichia coli]
MLKLHGRKLVFSVLLLCLSRVALSQTFTGDSKTVTFNMNIIRPSCTITAPAVVNLKGIKPGGWGDGGRLNIDITCESQTPTAVTVTPVKGTPQTTASTPGRALSFITRDGRDTGEAIILELMNGGDYLLFDSTDENCTGNQSRICEINTVVGAYTDRQGHLSFETVSSAVRFNLVYI